jgi:hypothetical protein
VNDSAGSLDSGKKSGRQKRYTLDSLTMRFQALKLEYALQLMAATLREDPPEH